MNSGFTAGANGERIIHRFVSKRTGQVVDVDVTDEIVRFVFSNVVGDMLDQLGLANTLAVFNQEVDASEPDVFECPVVSPVHLAGMPFGQVVEGEKLLSLSEDEREKIIEDAVEQFSKGIDGMLFGAGESSDDKDDSSDSNGIVDFEDVRAVRSWIDSRLSEVMLAYSGLAKSAQEAAQMSLYISDSIAVAVGHRFMNRLYGGKMSDVGEREELCEGVAQACENLLEDVSNV